MSTEEQNTQTTQIFKLKSESNYRLWSIVINLLLKSKDWLKIVNGEEKKSKLPPKPNSSDPSTLASSSKEKVATSAEKNKSNLKFIKSLADWQKKNAEAIVLFVYNINSDFLDKIHVDNTAKAIWDHFQNQFCKRSFTLRPILFIHPMTSKLSDFNTLQDFQIDFNSTLSKLHKRGQPLSRIFRLQLCYMRLKKLMINENLRNGLLYEVKGLMIFYLQSTT